MRIFRFKNSIASTRYYPVTGEYGVIGYFDALDIITDNDWTEEHKIELLADPNIDQLIHSNEVCDYYSIIGMRNENDNDFWDTDTDALIFISCIRKKKADLDMETILKEYEKNNKVVFYTTIDSSDVIICFKSYSYLSGQATLQDIQAGICKENFLIAFSVIAVKQEHLEKLEGTKIIDEQINSLTRCFVKNKNQSRNFLSLLKKEVEVSNAAFEASEIIGTDDVLIFIKGINLRKWLSFFGKGGCLNHRYCSGAFYNIQSSVIPSLDLQDIELYKNDCVSYYDDDYRLKKYYEQFSDDPLILHHIEKMMKLRWTYIKANDNALVDYLGRMISRVYPLFEEYFINRLDEYLENPKEKDRILSDLDYSIEIFWESEDAIIHTTNAADRIVIQTAAVDTGLRYVGPKLCYYYSEMLRELGNIFYYDGRYGFLVSPTMTESTNARVLFSTNLEHGKVSCIRISENNIADVGLENILLLHEFFHICPAELRLRKERAIHFLKILLYSVSFSLFDGIPLEEAEDRFYDYFTTDIFEKCKAEFSGKGEYDRCYYGSNVMNTYTRIISSSLQRLITINIKKVAELLDPRSCDSYKIYNRVHEKSLLIQEALRNKALEILIQSRLHIYCDGYMQIFREAYCDLMAILTLKVEPEDYIKAFNYQQIGEKIVEQRTPLALRIYFVTCAMTEKITPDSDEVIGKELFDKWSKWSQNNNGRPEDSIEGAVFKCGEYKANTSKIRNEESGLIISSNIFDIYNEYFACCRNKYVEFMARNRKKFDKWNTKYLHGKSTFEVLKAISLRKIE